MGFNRLSLAHIMSLSPCRATPASFSRAYTFIIENIYKHARRGVCSERRCESRGGTNKKIRIFRFKEVGEKRSEFSSFGSSSIV